MTDIHSKQLENVKHSIQAVFEDNPTPTESNYQHMLKLAAEAAIRAAFKPLSVKDMPKDGSKHLAVLEGDGPVVCYWDAYYAEGGRGYNGGDGWIFDDGYGFENINCEIGIIPIPTQESE